MDLVEIALLKSRIINRIRDFFTDRGFTEVHTPVLAEAVIPESYLDVFKTGLDTYEGKHIPLYLTPSPELWHKRLLSEGIGNIFEINSRFRNFDLGRYHAPEFTLLEWYHTGIDLPTAMDEVEELTKFLLNRSKLSYQGMVIDINRDFRRLSMPEVFKIYLDLPEADFFNKDRLIELADNLGIVVSEEADWSQVFNLVYTTIIESNLGKDGPVFVYNFPAEFAPLAKPAVDRRFKLRFELFIAGLELCDGYDELDDPKLQKQAFEAEIKHFQQQGRAVPRIDWDFIKALERGLPPSCGVAYGLDRLMMLIIDAPHINKVQLFPVGGKS